MSATSIRRTESPHSCITLMSSSQSPWLSCPHLQQPRHHGLVLHGVEAAGGVDQPAAHGEQLQAALGDAVLDAVQVARVQGVPLTPALLLPSNIESMLTIETLSNERPLSQW